MGIFSKLFSSKDSGRCHLLVHLPSINGNGQNGSARLSPGDIVQTLNRLSNFAKREDLPVSAFVESKPLRDAQDGEAFKGITTFFIGAEHEADAQLKRAVRHVRKDGRAVLVTSHPGLEAKAASLGIEILKGSALLKAIDVSFDAPGDRSRGGRDGRRRRNSNSRGGRGRGDRNDRGDGRNNNHQDQQNKGNTDGDNNDPISQLIDIVE